jgi:hypothetical protein
MKKLDVPIVQHEDGRVGLVINHTKDKNYLHVVELGDDKLSSTTQSWMLRDVKPWDEDIIISNRKKRIL